MPENRLTVEQIRADAREAHMTVMCSTWFSWTGGHMCGCPMAIHYIASEPAAVRSQRSVEMWGEKKFGRDYFYAFINAFDRGFGHYLTGGDAKRLNDGAVDGMAARAAFFNSEGVTLLAAN